MQPHFHLTNRLTCKNELLKRIPAVETVISTLVIIIPEVNHRLCGGSSHQQLKIQPRETINKMQSVVSFFFALSANYPPADCVPTPTSEGS